MYLPRFKLVVMVFLMYCWNLRLSLITWPLTGDKSFKVFRVGSFTSFLIFCYLDKRKEIYSHVNCLVTYYLQIPTSRAWQFTNLTLTQLYNHVAWVNVLLIKNTWLYDAVLNHINVKDFNFNNNNMPPKSPDLLCGGTPVVDLQQHSGRLIYIPNLPTKYPLLSLWIKIPKSGVYS